MRESDFSKRLVRALRESAACLVHRIENSSMSGLPDMWASTHTGKQFWIETKVTEKVTHEPKFERNQKLIHDQMWQVGVPVLVVIGSPDGIRIRLRNRGTGITDEWRAEDIKHSVLTILYHVGEYYRSNGI